MLDPFSINRGNLRRNFKCQQKLDDQLMSLGAALGQTAAPRGQFERAVRDGLYQSRADQSFDDPKCCDMRNTEPAGEVRVAALTFGGGDFGNRLDVVFGFLAGVVPADPLVCGLLSVRAAVVSGHGLLGKRWRRQIESLAGRQAGWGPPRLTVEWYLLQSKSVANATSCCGV